MQAPTIGRDVLFTPGADDALTQPTKARITGLWGDGRVNLSGRDPEGQTFERTRVLLLEAGTGARPPCCEYLSTSAPKRTEPAMPHGGDASRAHAARAARTGARRGRKPKGETAKV